MDLSREQRILNTINRKQVDYLPSVIAFSEVTRNNEIAHQLGLGDEKELKEYLDNHLSFVLIGTDLPLFYRNDLKEMNNLIAKGLAGMDLENGVVYDSWGVGIKMHTEGFFPCYHPLQQKQDLNKTAYKYIPESFKKEIIFYNDAEQSMNEFEAPDASSDINWEGIEETLKRNDGQNLIAISGYGGIFERAYHVLGFEELMTYMVLYPEVLESFLDKILEHKLKVAQKAVELGVKIGHFGDDLGTQTGLIFSKEMFRKFYKPRYKHLFEVYHKAGIPIQMHSCGNITEIIPDLVDIGLTVLEPVQPCMDLKYIKKEFGKDLIFYGGIDTQIHLPYMTPEQVKAMVKDTIYCLGKGGGYIVAPAQEITKDIPLENVRALIETVLLERKRVLDI